MERWQQETSSQGHWHNIDKVQARSDYGGYAQTATGANGAATDDGTWVPNYRGQ